MILWEVILFITVFPNLRKDCQKIEENLSVVNETFNELILVLYSHSFKSDIAGKFINIIKYQHYTYTYLKKKKSWPLLGQY